MVLESNQLFIYRETMQLNESLEIKSNQIF